MQIEKQTDEELWKALKKGDAKAFDVLFNRYWSNLFSTAYVYLQDREICSEVVNDIFLSIWLKRERLNIVSFEAYITSAARYHVYKHLKAIDAKRVQYSINPEIFNRKDSYNKGEEKLCYKELETAVETHLDTLPKRCLQIYNLSRKDFLSNEEIASELGISKRSVENQITFALKHIRMLIKSLYYILAVGLIIRS